MEEELSEQHHISHGEVYGKNNHCRQDTLEYGPYDIEDIAQEPHYEKLQ